MAGVDLDRRNCLDSSSGWSQTFWMSLSIMQRGTWNAGAAMLWRGAHAVRVVWEVWEVSRGWEPNAAMWFPAPMGRLQASRWVLLIAQQASFCVTTARLPDCEESSAWLAALQRSGRSTSTIDAYRGDLVSIATAVEHILGHPATTASLSLIGQHEIDRMQRLWSDEGAARATSLRRFAALRGLSKFLSMCGDNCSGILSSALPLPHRLPPQAAPEEVIRPLLEPIGDSWIAGRDASLIRTLAETGATGAEVVAIDSSHVFWEAGGVALASGTAAARLATLSDEALAMVKSYRNRSPFGFSNFGPLFLNRDGARLTARSLQVMLARRAKELGMPGRAAAMSLRHRYGQMLADSGHSPEIVAARMGISVSTAIKYFTLPRHRIAPARKEDCGRRGRRPNASNQASTPR
jgi:integrase/recombinase XerC